MEKIKTEGICEGDIIIDDTIINHKFHVVKDNKLTLETDGIIGADLLRAAQPSISKTIK